MKGAEGTGDLLAIITCNVMVASTSGMHCLLCPRSLRCNWRTYQFKRASYRLSKHRNEQRLCKSSPAMRCVSRYASTGNGAFLASSNDRRILVNCYEFTGSMITTKIPPEVLQRRQLAGASTQFYLVRLSKNKVGASPGYIFSETAQRRYHYGQCVV